MTRKEVRSRHLQVVFQKKRFTVKQKKTLQICPKTVSGSKVNANSRLLGHDELSYKNEMR